METLATIKDLLSTIKEDAPPAVDVKTTNGHACKTNGGGHCTNGDTQTANSAAKLNGAEHKDKTKMHVFLVQTAQGLTPSSGGYKANYCLLRQLVAAGHNASQICYGFEKEVETYAEEALKHGVQPGVTEDILDVADTEGKIHHLIVNTFTDKEKIYNIVISREPFNLAYPTKEFFRDTQHYLEHGTIDDSGKVHNVSARIEKLIDLFSKSITDCKPTHVVFNDALTMKLAAHHPLRDTFKRVAVIHTAEQLPFGPFSQGIDGHCLSPKLENSMLRDLDGVWSVSRAIQDYSMTYGDLDTDFFVHSTLTYMDAKTSEMPKARFNIDKDEVGMVNPCPHKGLDILLDLAKQLPHIKFVTWASWGSGPEHIEQLSALKNVKVLPTTRDTDEIWDRIKILLAPSVWHEAWGIIVTEAQLRGIPVIASKAGGLPEAKIGLPYSLPVNMVTGQRHLNGHYVVPEQDITLWKEKLELLMTDREWYTKVATMTAEKSAEWLRGLDPNAHEKWLLSMMERK